MIGPITKAGGVSTHTISLISELKSRGNHVIHYNTYGKRDASIPIFNNINIFLNKSVLLFFFLLHNYSDFDIIHIQSSGPIGGFMPALVGSFLQKLVKYKLIITFHYSNTELFTNRYTSLIKFVIEKSNYFIVVSNKQKEVIISKLGLKYNDKIIVIPNGYNPASFYNIPRNEAIKILGLSNKYRILVNVALLAEKKGQKYLIDTMNIIVNEKGIKNIKCFIIGSGLLHKKLEIQISQYNLNNYIKLTGWVSNQELNQYLSAAELFILPSLSEGNPTVMFEALGSGLPFIGTRVGGVPEIIFSEDYGLLCEPADSQTLAKNILLALKKKWDRKKIVKYAKQFTWENITTRTIHAYSEILKLGQIHL